MIQAVLFDFDGVLCDLKGVHFDALNNALSAHGYDTIGGRDHQSVFDGLPTREKLKKLVELGRVRAGDVESIQALKQRETLEKACTVPFDPGVYCLLSGITRGRKAAVVSNAVRDTVVSALQTMSIHDFFDAVVTNEDGPCKPAPDLYQKACRMLRLDPGECLAVEDNQYGIRAAEAAGCVVCPVTCPADVTPKLIWSYLCSTS